MPKIWFLFSIWEGDVLILNLINSHALSNEMEGYSDMDWMCEEVSWRDEQLERNLVMIYEWDKKSQWQNFCRLPSDKAAIATDFATAKLFLAVLDIVPSHVRMGKINYSWGLKIIFA